MDLLIIDMLIDFFTSNLVITLTILTVYGN